MKGTDSLPKPGAGLSALARLLKSARRGPGRAGRRAEGASQQWQDFSHDLRANVQSIAAAATASLEQPDPGIQRAALQDIAAAAAALDLQLTGALDGSTAATGAVSAFELDHEVARVCQRLQPLARRRHKHLLLDTRAGACVTVEANRDALVRIVQNLIINAVRYAESSSILVEVHCTDTLYVAVRNAASRLTKADSRGLLTRRRRGRNARSADGRGLGLAISRRLARQLGGSVAIVTDQGEFVGVLQMPVAVLAAHPPQLELDVRVQAPEPLLRAVFARQLRSAGLQVVTAARTPAALCVTSADGTERQLLHADLLELGDPPALRALCHALSLHVRNPLSVLVVDDNRVARARLLQLLGQLAFGEITSVADVDTARALLATRRFDHIIIDAHLGRSSGLQLRDRLAQTDGPNRNAGVVVISAAPDVTRAVAARPASAPELAALLGLQRNPAPATQNADTSTAFRAETVAAQEHTAQMSAEMAAELASELRAISQRLAAGALYGLDGNLHTLAGVARVWQQTELAELLHQVRMRLPADPDGAAEVLRQAINAATTDD